jgi:tripartite-type tricarboxylate transporter receptor subunit TctC
MKLNRRHLIVVVVAGLIGAALSEASAGKYPERPIKVIVPYSAGGITDVQVRRVAERLGPALGQPVIVENRPGASGTIGLAAGATARPDGYTLMLGSTSNLVVSPALGVPIAYDPVKSFDPIILFGSTPMVFLAHPSLGVQTVAELVAVAKAKPGALSYGTGGATTTAHLIGEVFKESASIELLHVPYKGTTPALIAVLANEVPLGIDFPDTCAAHVAAGKLRALMVTGSRRVGLLAGVPHAVETGYPQLDILAWGGFLAPSGTPKEVLDLLNREIAKILASPETREQLNKAGWEIGGGSPEQFRTFIKAEQLKWGGVVKLAGVRIEQ